MSGVPAINIVRQDIAPVLAREFFALGSSYDRKMAARLVEEAFENPAPGLNMVMKAVEDVRLELPIHEIKAISSEIVRIALENLKTDPIILERENVPSIVFERLALHEFGLVMSWALKHFAPQDLNIRVVLDTTPFGGYCPN